MDALVGINFSRVQGTRLDPLPDYFAFVLLPL
jgi:hypothetical protein